MARNPSAKIKKQTVLHKGFYDFVQVDLEVGTFSGGVDHYTRELYINREYVAVLCHDPARDEVVLVKQCRPAPLTREDDPFMLEIPAGLIDEDETSIEAAMREVTEETGLKVTDLNIIHPGFYPAAAITTEKGILFYTQIDASQAKGLHGTDEHEDIQVVVLKTDDFIGQVQSGQIMDMKTIFAAWWLHATLTATNAQTLLK